MPIEIQVATDVNMRRNTSCISTTHICIPLPAPCVFEVGHTTGWPTRIFAKQSCSAIVPSLLSALPGTVPQMLGARVVASLLGDLDCPQRPVAVFMSVRTCYAQARPRDDRRWHDEWFRVHYPPSRCPNNSAKTYRCGGGQPWSY